MQVVQLDVSDAASVSSAVDAVKSALAGKPLDGLINNAGGIAGGPGAMGYSTPEHFLGTMELNYLHSAVRVTEAFLPILDAVSGKGRIVHVASGAAPSFVAKVDALKEQQKEFKAKCKEEYAAMEAKRAAQLSGGGDDDDRRVAEIEKLYDAEHAKVLQMRRLAGQKGRQIAALQRQVDEIPNRAELLQYERRFRELYAMIAQKGDETRKYYAMYNVLEEKKTYVTKEISLINSIHENFTKAMSEKAAAREKLAEATDGIVKTVQATQAKTQGRLDDELASKAALQAKYDKLLGQQRKYFKLVKELKEAYQKQAEAEDDAAKAAAGGS